MKKQVLAAFVICAAVIIGVLYCFPVFRIVDLTDSYYYNREEVGMLISIGSRGDRDIANGVMELAEAAFSDIQHTGEENRMVYGELSRYAINADLGAARETHELKLLSAHIDDTSGYIWVRYSQTAYDAEGNMVCGSSNILSLWQVEKNDTGEWKVTYIKEHP